jgi:hypothetical protein
MTHPENAQSIVQLSLQLQDLVLISLRQQPDTDSSPSVLQFLDTSMDLLQCSDEMNG